VTDLPVTEDVDVCIHFTHVVLRHSGGELVEIPYDASTYTDATDCINNLPSDQPLSANNAVALSALQGELTAYLFESEVVTAGDYSWIRLYIDETLSYVIDSEGQKTLTCPSCNSDESGFKLNGGIVVPAGGAADYVIDLDLAKSLNRGPSGNYRLRPTARLVDNGETGTVSGSVESALIPAMVSDTDTGCKVYVYEGRGVVPDDYHETDNVLTSAKVLFDPTFSTSYGYVAAFLPTDSATDPTPFTAALTCDVDDTEIDQNNDPSIETGTDVIFTDGSAEGMGQDFDVSTDQSVDVPF